MAGVAGMSGVTTGRSAARERKLHVGHFAFMRSIAQGVEPRAAWDRYLGNEGDASDSRNVRSTLAWIRSEFAAAARREDRYSTARLVRLDVASLGRQGEVLPSLDDFAADHGLEDHSQAEQIAAFEQRYGAASARARKRARLIERQLEALRWLERILAQPPQAGDAVVSWLDPVLASHLERAEIYTLAQLADRINGIGRRWFAAVPALGEVKATRIVEWLREHADTTGLQIGSHVALARTKLLAHELKAVVAPASDVRPLEKFVVPGDLDGRHGLYRRPQAQCLLAATNDYQAVLAWLRSKQGLTPAQKASLKDRRRQRDTGVELGLDWLQSLSHTQRSYRKEAERFMLWAIVNRRKALSSMTNEDCVAYREFLADPAPRSTWCAPRSRERWSPLWRPFEGPLSPAAQNLSLSVLKNLYAFLVDQNYLMGNPWSSIAVPRSARPRLDVGRSFTKAQWRFVLGQLEQQPSTSRTRRLAFALRLLYATGLRISEVVEASVDDLELVDFPADAENDEPMQGWTLNVVGKGDRLREVPVPDDVIAELRAYLTSRGMAADPQDLGNQGTRLLGKASDAGVRAATLRRGEGYDPREGVAAGTLYVQLKNFFKECGDVMRRMDAKGAQRLAKASTHWLRHTHATHAIAAGMPVQIAQQNLGHASLATTTVYVTTERRRRMAAVNSFWKVATDGKGR